MESVYLLKTKSMGQGGGKTHAFPKRQNRPSESNVPTVPLGQKHDPV